jgi:hypothetical protein|tara:strand:+ start:105 stop:518 length:414 start_codon:yes stop_codon:yes gene_type:complete
VGFFVLKNTSQKSRRFKYVGHTAYFTRVSNLSFVFKVIYIYIIMGMLSKIWELLEALLKLGFTYVLDYFPSGVQKKFDSPVKKPQESKPKKQGTGYISIRDMTEIEESRWRQEFMSEVQDFSEYAEVNEFTLKQKKI